MSDSMPRFRRPRALLLAALLVGALATGCSRVPSNTPQACDSEDDTNCGYTATSEGSTEPVTEINFMKACVEAQTDADVTEDDATSDCQCQYKAIVEDIPFDEFKSFETQLEEDPADVPAEYETIAEDCQDGGGGSSLEGEGATTTTGNGEGTTTAPPTTAGEAG